MRLFGPQRTLLSAELHAEGPPDFRVKAQVNAEALLFHGQCDRLLAEKPHTIDRPTAGEGCPDPYRGAWALP